MRHLTGRWALSNLRSVLLVQCRHSCPTLTALCRCWWLSYTPSWRVLAARGRASAQKPLCHQCHWLEASLHGTHQSAGFLQDARCGRGGVWLQFSLCWQPVQAPSAQGWCNAKAWPMCARIGGHSVPSCLSQSTEPIQSAWDSGTCVFTEAIG